MIQPALSHETLTQTPLAEARGPRLLQEIDWVSVGRKLPARFAEAPIVLIPPEKTPTSTGLLKRFPHAERIFAVDFYVDGAEKGELLSSGAGYRIGEKLYNIDHHAADRRWETHVSSGNLACRWVERHGTLRAGKDVLVLNHTDCDSILSALILTGALPPCQRLEEAVLDADHRGVPSPIVDILQSLFNTRDLSGAVNALSRELQGLPPDERTAKALELLHEKRTAARELVRDNVVVKNGVAFIRCNRFLESDIFLSLLPQSIAIVIACPSEKYPEIELTRIRLGPQCPPGASLHRLGVAALDPYFGGRFDAGSNKRGLEHARQSGIMPEVVPAQKHFESLVEQIQRLCH